MTAGDDIPQLLSPQLFCGRFRDHFDISVEPQLTSHLVDDLSLDSFAMMVVLFWVEALANPHDLPLEAPTFDTVGDIYSYYVTIAA